MIPKFRAFWKSEKKTIYVDWIRFGNKDLIGKVDGQTILPVGFEDVVLMQSTGLFDANGKEIFEGDVVKYGKDLFLIKLHPFGGISVTGSDNVESFHGLDLLHELEELAKGFSEDFEVIGNIHQHPHLMEGEVNDNGHS